MQPAIRRSCLAATAAIAALAAATAGASSAAPIRSDAKPNRTLDSYCSSSGDVCFGIVSRSGGVYLDLSTAARYFGRYRLCVRPPGAARALRCGSYPVSRRGTVWGSSVKYSRNFPVVGQGTYRVIWKLKGRALGPTLRFRLPLG
jgi:hypothetical protein